MIEFKSYGVEKLAKDIEKAIKKYEELHFTSVDKVKETKIRLPKIITKTGEEIDLEKKYRGSTIVMTQVGVLLGILYVQDKLGVPRVFFHVFEKPRVMLTSDDGKSIFIAEDGKEMVTDRGVVA